MGGGECVTPVVELTMACDDCMRTLGELADLGELELDECSAAIAPSASALSASALAIAVATCPPPPVVVSATARTAVRAAAAALVRASRHSSGMARRSAPQRSAQSSLLRCHSTCQLLRRRTSASARRARRLAEGTSSVHSVCELSPSLSPKTNREGDELVEPTSCGEGKGEEARTGVREKKKKRQEKSEEEEEAGEGVGACAR